VADHNSIHIDQLPTSWIQTVRQKVAWIYGHTSHGSQLVDGAIYLSQYENPPTYNFITHWYTIPAQEDPIGMRVGDDDGWGWDESSYLQTARDHLDAAHQYLPNQITVFMWSWCGEQSDNSIATVQNYLNMMNQLEGEYPDVFFVYMTGHTDKWSQATLKRNNDIVRNYVLNNGKLLYDFADIESYLPDGTPYSVPHDSCPWCQDWCNTHPGYCPDPPISDCAHSHSLNCLLKGKAWWWLSARLAGWDGNP
jgi:hypothetical protein